MNYWSQVAQLPPFQPSKLLSTMSDLGLLKQFLGLEIEKNYDGIMVTQYK